jgi:alpha-ribazole phosphatase
MKLIFIRHPETEANVRKVIYGRTDSWYSPKGEASVALVTERLRDLEIDRIYASPLKRAAFLAEEITVDHNRRREGEPLKVAHDDRLIEMNFGIFENKSNQEAKELYGEGFEKLWQDFLNFKIPGGENLTQVRDRVVDFLKEICAQEPVGRSLAEELKEDPIGALEPAKTTEITLVIVAHSLVIRSALSWFLNISLEDIWHIDIKPAGMVEILYRNGYAMLTKLTSLDQ